MKKIFKKNQIMITVLALMLAVAGYLNFAGKGVGEELATNSDEIYDEEELALLDISDEDIESLDSDYVSVIDNNMKENEIADTDLNAFISETIDGEFVDADISENLADSSDDMTVDELPGEAIFTSATAVGSLSGAKLMKEQTRSKNKETLLEIINNTEIADEQKQAAIDQMIQLTGIAEQETSAEILLEARGFDDVVVSMSDSGVDVMVGMAELTEAECAQIFDIVQRKTGFNPENIIITPIGEQ